MATRPRATLDDTFIEGRDCAICGEAALQVVHLPNLPDYVSCAHCKSAFLVEEGGERVFYGEIPEEYPKTAQFALRQWTWPEAIANRAREERPAPEPTPAPDAGLPLSPEPEPEAEDETGWAALQDQPLAAPEAAEITPEVSPDGFDSGAPFEETALEDAWETPASEIDLPPESPQPLEQPEPGVEPLAPPEPYEEATPAWDDDLMQEPPLEAAPPIPENEPAEDDFLASLRHSAAIPLESEPLEPASIEEPPEERPLEGEALEAEPEAGDLLAARMEAIVDTSGPQPEAEAAPAEVAMEPPQEGAEPPPGQRYRVVIRGERVIFPGGECAHCSRDSVKGRLAVHGTLPRSQGMGDRKPTTFQVPLCGDCRRRAAQLSSDAKAARLQGHLISAIVGMVLVVGALAIDLIDPRTLDLADAAIMAILLIVGYTGTALVLLNRVGSYPPPPDAAYVQSTLLVPRETQGLETAFEWRNEGYATRFYEANYANALGKVTAVKDRAALEPPAEGLQD